MTVPRGSRTFRLAVTPSQPLAAGEYVLRVGARAGPASIPSREVARLTIPQAPDAMGALFVRRGASTANKDVPTADLRFRRNEQVRVEIPIASAGSADGAPAGSHRQTARGAGDGSRPRRCRRLTLGDGAARARAAGAGGLRDRAWPAGGHERMISAFRVVP